MNNKLKSLANQVLTDSGIMIALAWVAAEAIGWSSLSAALVAFGCACVVAAKRGKPAPAWAVVIIIVAVGGAVHLGLLT